MKIPGNQIYPERPSSSLVTRREVLKCVGKGALLGLLGYAAVEAGKPHLPYLMKLINGKNGFSCMVTGSLSVEDNNEVTATINDVSMVTDFTLEKSFMGQQALAYINPRDYKLEASDEVMKSITQQMENGATSFSLTIEFTRDNDNAPLIGRLISAKAPKKSEAR